MAVRIRNRRHLHAKQVIEKRPIGPRHLAFPRSVVMQGPVGLAKRVGRDQLGQGRVPAAFVEMRRERPAHITKHQGKSDLSRSEEHTSELKSLMRISYAVFCLKKKKTK